MWKGVRTSVEGIAKGNDGAPLPNGLCGLRPLESGTSSLLDVPAESEELCPPRLVALIAQYGDSLPSFRVAQSLSSDFSGVSTTLHSNAVGCHPSRPAPLPSAPSHSALGLAKGSAPSQLDNNEAS
eukprot:scaffold128265_cov35-Tisochrysis_lutea.AAC.3